MRKSILEAANDIGTYPDTKVVLAGMANVYIHYITTFEEYQVQVNHLIHMHPKSIQGRNFQRYEGGATLYGPHTLAAYQKQYKKLTKQLLNAPASARGYSFRGVPPPDLSSVQLPQVPSVIFDAPKVNSMKGNSQLFQANHT